MVTLQFRGVAVVCLAVTTLAACSSAKQGNAPDSAAVAQHIADSLEQVAQSHAAELLSAAQADIASLLKKPATATFTELKVVQPPMKNDRLPPMVACGMVAGKPGMGEKPGPVKFIYQSRQTVFVEDATNHQPFTALWDESCGNPGSKVIAGATDGQ